MNATKIKKVTMSFFFIFLFGAQMAYGFNTFNYSVMVINQTDEVLEVHPFSLNDSKESAVRIGEIQPHGRASYGPCYTAPQKQVIIKWLNTKTQKEEQAAVKVALPKEFTKKNGLTIYFYLSKNNIRAAYKVFDEKKGDSVEINSADSD